MQNFLETYNQNIEYKRRAILHSMNSKHQYVMLIFSLNVKDKNTHDYDKSLEKIDGGARVPANPLKIVITLNRQSILLSELSAKAHLVR